MLTKDEHSSIRALIVAEVEFVTDIQAVMNIINAFTEGSPITRVSPSGHIATKWGVSDD